jgi:hypothetical protein
VVNKAFFFKKSYIFIEHSGQVWYNYNRPKKGRLAENRTSRAAAQVNYNRAYKAPAAHEKPSRARFQASKPKFRTFLFW